MGFLNRSMLRVMAAIVLTGCSSAEAPTEPSLDAQVTDAGLAIDANQTNTDSQPNTTDSTLVEDTQAPCDPASAVTETCNGVDEDCDGQTDESSCDDGNPCTKDLCDPTASPVCSYSNADDAPCDDGDACTSADACKDGACVAGPMKDCDDNNPCTGTESCTDGACVSANAIDCDDADPCTVDSCQPSDGKCVYGQALDGSACDDNKVCTSNDACMVGVCQGTVDCNDNDPCTKDGCDATGACSQSKTTGPTCDDGKVCTQLDGCVDGVCQGTVACDDSNPCTEDACDLAGACTSTAVTGGSCDDGNPCSTKETCQTGTCVAGASTCDDGDICTMDSCNPLSGACSYSAVPQGVACDDNKACTSVSTCQNGVCKGAVDCDDSNPCTMDTCDAQTGACVHTGVNDGQACDADGNGCTVNDECKAGKCVAGATVSCMLADKPCDVFTCVSLSASTHKCQLSQKPGCVVGARTAVADAEVYKSNPNGNYGKKTSMTVDRGNHYVYLKFDLKDVPKTAKLVGATLSVTAYTGYAWGGDGNVYTTLVDNDTWSETSLNWNNKPAVTGGSLGSWWLWYNNNTSVKTVSVKTQKFLQVVQEQVAKDGVLSLRLHSPGYKTLYRSREYSKDEHRPKLELYYTTK